jgi:RimJ/RimL family protein N-acetyltransferase
LTSRTTAFRSIADASDVERILPFIQKDGACPLTAQRYLENFEDGQYRPGFTWLAEHVNTHDVLAVAVWWGAPNGTAPGALDAIYVHESIGTGDEGIAMAAELLEAGHKSFAEHLGLTTPPEYHVFVPGDWRDQPDVVLALDWRRRAVAEAGLGSLLERLRYEWTPASGLIEPIGRLEFRPEPDDEVFVDLFTRVLDGSLDTTSATEAAKLGARAQARQDMEYMRDMLSGDRSWWFVAVDADGQTVGFGIPSHNPTYPIVGYLGVLPEHRGNGHVDPILAEITRVLAVDQEVEIIRADTDLVNRPMAAAFERAGYRNFARRLVFSAR